jgi:hypothetical protein
MYERSLNEAERILATHKDVVVPVKEIWLEVSKQGQFQRFEVPSLVDFTALLEGDDRFEFFPAGDEMGDNYVEPFDEDEVEYSTDMKRLGFYTEDRVRLRNVEVSEDLAEDLTEEQQESSESLNGQRSGSQRSTTESERLQATSRSALKHKRVLKLKPAREKLKKKSVRTVTTQKRKGKSR